MSPARKALEKVLQERRARWTPSQIDLAELVMTDLAVLAGRHAAGENVSQRLAEAGAAAKNIIAGEVVAGASVVHEAIIGLLGGVLNRALFGGVV